MGTGYTRNDTSNNIADGNIINAADLDGEFDAIESAFGTSGHTHDGTSAEGGPITVLGPVQDFVASATEIKPKTTNTLDIGTSGLLFKDMFLDGVATMGSIKIDNAGTIGSASDADAIAISSGGVVSFSQNTIGKTGSGYVLSLQTSDTTIEATNVLGKIEFSAPDEASGTDAILVGASIEALAEATFDSTTNSTALVFKTNTTGAATERMRLTSAGNLHFLDNRKAIFGAGSDLQIYSDGNTSFIKESGAGNFAIDGTNIFVRNGAGTANMAAFVDGGAASLYHNSTARLATTSTGIDVTGTVTADGLTVDGDVQLGVENVTNGVINAPESVFINFDSNNDDTAEKFIIASNATGSSGTKHLQVEETGDISFYEDTGTTAKFFWDASAESLGIGTSSPMVALNVHDSTNARIALTNSSTGQTFPDGFELLATGLDAYLQNRSNGNMVFTTNNTERMRINSSGNVLVGKTSADFGATSGVEFRGDGRIATGRAGESAIFNRLTTDGDIALFRKDGTTVGSIGVAQSGDRTYFAGGTYGIAADTSETTIMPCGTTGTGNDGVVNLGKADARFKDLYLSGTVTAATLNVDGGTIKLDGNYPVGTNNVALGDTALDSMASGGTRNTAIGFAAGTALTTQGYNVFVGSYSGDGATGSSNVAVGDVTLRNTSGSFNTAIGGEALNSNTTASNNTAVGYQAAYSNTTGSQITSVGYQALNANTTAFNNNAFGLWAAKNTTTGQFNNAFGTSALLTNTTGSNNTAIGESALRLNTTASNNTAVGYQAGYSNTTGTPNTFVGHQAGYSNSTGSNLTAFGNLALYSNTTGGLNAGTSQNALYSNTTGDSNTATGVNSMYSNTTGSNNVGLGKDALRSNTTATSNTAVGYQALYSQTTAQTGHNTGVGYQAGYTGNGYYNTYIGYISGKLATGYRNTFIGHGAGNQITTGNNNTILGTYTGNQGGLDIRTSSNNIVLSDGDGNPRMFSDPNGRFNINRSGTYNARLALDETGAANIACDVFASNTGYYNQVLQVRCARGGTTGYNLIQARNSTNTECFKVDGYGDVKNTNNSYGAISDEKLKENIVDSGSQWDDVKALRVRKYSMKADSLDAPNKLGVIAQELEAAGMSGLVSETPDRDDDGTDLGTVTKAVAYSILYMKAVKALQEAMDRIETLEAKVTALENA